MIGIISDTHDNVASIQKSVSIFNKKRCSLVIHCGDIIAPITIPYFRGLNIRFVQGNCDGDTEFLKKKAEEIHAEFCGEVCDFEKNGRRFLAYHGKDSMKLQRFIDQQKFDYILTGHTHHTMDKRIGKTRLINPGAHYYGCENKIAVLDEEKDKLEFIEVK